MVLLGLLPLAAVARVTGVEAEHTFLLPTLYALAVGLVIGMVACAILGRTLGLLTSNEIGTYAERHRQEAGAAAAARRRGRPQRSRIRAGAATVPLARFS